MTLKHDFENLHIIDHPIVQDRLTKMRDENADTPTFRKMLREISVLMAYEVTKDLALASRHINTPVTTMDAPVLKDKEPVIIPILRAGLGMSEGLGEVLTNASYGHIGVCRDEETHRPVEYLVKLPPDIAERDVIIVDPMLATGHSMEFALDVLQREGVPKNHMKMMVLVAAPEGVVVLQDKYSSVLIYTAALDEHLNENAYIVPGLGDAGDRIFGTVPK